MIVRSVRKGPGSVSPSARGRSGRWASWISLISLLAVVAAFVLDDAVEWVRLTTLVLAAVTLVVDVAFFFRALSRSS
jgi:hypothetical protein